MKHLILAALLLAAAPAFSQDHSHHESKTVTRTAQQASTAAFLAANAKMHKGMDIEFTGDADVDFVRGMIAHHQGAIDMAQVQIKYGKDSDMKDLARNIIKAQKSEISAMKKWLSSHARRQRAEARGND